MSGKPSNQRPLALMNWKLTTAERDTLKAAAADRGMTVSSLIRAGLRREGVLLER